MNSEQNLSELPSLRHDKNENEVVETQQMLVNINKMHFTIYMNLTQEYIHAATSDNTRRAYQADIRHFTAMTHRPREHVRNDADHKLPIAT